MIFTHIKNLNLLHRIKKKWVPLKIIRFYGRHFRLIAVPFMVVESTVQDSNNDIDFKGYLINRKLYEKYNFKKNNK